MVEEKIWQKSNIMNLNLTPILKSVITPQTYIQQYINSITGVDLKPQGVCAISCRMQHDSYWTFRCVLIFITAVWCLTRWLNCRPQIDRMQLQSCIYWCGLEQGGICACRCRWTPLCAHRRGIAPTPQKEAHHQAVPGRHKSNLNFTATTNIGRVKMKKCKNLPGWI